MDELKAIKKASNFIKNKTRISKYDIAVIFGSGLSPEPNDIQGIHIPYKNIPGFPISDVYGHLGRLVSFSVDKKKILFFMGRIHYYEGLTPKETVLPIRIMKELGVSKLILTNAAGAINPKLKLGSLMLIKDHINLTGLNPLVGVNIIEHGQRFIDMSNPYSLRLSNLAKKLSPVKLKEGVYIGVTGPTYETKAEVNFFKKIGADAAGMSTVMETITAAHCGIETLGISCIVNTAPDNSSKKISHEEILKVSNTSKVYLIELINKLIKEV